MNTLFPIFYFGPISYFSFLAKNGVENCLFEVCENFPKQTYRNRCYILGANGELCLTIPIEHKKNNRIIKETKISYDFNWQKQHVKSIESAYRSSPYFEYYEDSLHSLYEKKDCYLLDFTQNTLRWILDKLDLPNEIKLTQSYQNQEMEFRNAFSTKKETDLEKNTIENTSNYFQVFSEKHGFIKNLSILDLLFNCGPNSINYLT